MSSSSIPFPNPRVGHFPTTPIKWSNGTNFSGFILIGLVPPTFLSGQAPQVDFSLIYPTEVIPTNAIIPINNGMIDQSLGLFYNQDISPPNSEYYALFYDSSKALIGGSNTNYFIVSTNPINNLPIPTLTAPTST